MLDRFRSRFSCRVRPLTRLSSSAVLRIDPLSAGTLHCECMFPFVKGCWLGAWLELLYVHLALCLQYVSLRSEMLIEASYWSKSANSTFGRNADLKTWGASHELEIALLHDRSPRMCHIALLLCTLVRTSPLTHFPNA